MIVSFRIKLRILWTDRKTNTAVWTVAGVIRSLIKIVRERKLNCMRRIYRRSGAEKCNFVWG